MKLFLSMCLLISLNSMASDCSLYFNAQDLCAKLEWTYGPVLNDTSSFELSFWNKQNPDEFVSPKGSVSVKSWMYMDSGMNHGGPTIYIAEKEPGVFISDDARFFLHGMTGYWVVKVIVNDESIEQKVPLPNGH